MGDKSGRKEPVTEAPNEQLVRRALGIFSKVISGNVLFSKRLWEYLGGSKVIPYELFVRLGMHQMYLDLPRFPFSKAFCRHGETMPAKGEMVKLKRKLGDFFDWDKLTQYQELVDDVPGSENAPLAEAAPFAEDALLAAANAPLAEDGRLAEDVPWAGDATAGDPSSNDNGIGSGGDAFGVILDDDEKINEI